MLIGIIAFGTFGYYFVEHMPLFEAFYMTIITVSTVGFSEIVPLSIAGRALTVIIIILGITVGAYTIGMLVRAFIEGELVQILGRRKVQKQIAELKKHFIICGFGRIGRIICSELDADNIDFVVIEQDPSAIESIEIQSYLYLEMDATSEEALMAAGIMNAKGIATAVNSDANNVFITMTAKSLRPDIFVLARGIALPDWRATHGPDAQEADCRGLYRYCHDGQPSRPDDGGSQNRRKIQSHRQKSHRQPSQERLRGYYRGHQKNVRRHGI